MLLRELEPSLQVRICITVNTPFCPAAKRGNPRHVSTSLRFGVASEGTTFSVNAAILPFPFGEWEQVLCTHHNFLFMRHFGGLMLS